MKIVTDELLLRQLVRFMPQILYGNFYVEKQVQNVDFIELATLCGNYTDAFRCKMSQSIIII